MEKTFGERLEELMKSAGYNKNSLSREAGMHPTTLKNWIDNKTSPDDLKLDILTRLLNTSKNYLFTGTGNKYVIAQETQKKKECEFKSLPITEQLQMIYQNQMEQDEKLNKVIKYIDDLFDPFYEYLKTQGK